MPELPDTRTSASSAETEAIAAKLARTLDAGDVVLLSGDLGAGKTTFVRGAARELGVTGPVTSPTFTIGHLYELDAQPAEADAASAARAPRAVSHLDLYRLGSIAAEDPDLLADYIGADTIAFVEWPASGEHELEQLGRIAYRITLEHAGGDTRRLTIVAGHQADDRRRA